MFRFALFPGAVVFIAASFVAVAAVAVSSAATAAVWRTVALPTFSAFWAEFGDV